MAENEGMEGKDLAQEERKEEKNRLQLAIKNLKKGQTTISTEGLEITNFGGLYTLKMRGITFGTLDEDGKPTYIMENVSKLKEALKDEGIELESLDLPDLQQAIDQEEQAKRQEEQQEENQEGNENDGEEKEEEKGDENPELDEEEQYENDDEKKEELARQFGISSSQVIHISKNKKITKENFGQIADWSKNYEDIYVVPGEDEFSKKFIGVNNGKQEEIEGAQKMVRGKNPDITIKRIDGDKITEIRPVAAYELPDGGIMAFTRDEGGKSEALYCRPEAGDKKAYWGSVIPEASGKNIYQQGPETREFIDHKYNSSNDLSKKADELEKQKDFEKRGAPSEQEGVQISEIEGNAKQNREAKLAEIIEDLKRRDGIIDEATMPPGYYEHKAEKVLNTMEHDEDIYYEDAVDKVYEEDKREEGGRTPGEPRDKRGE